MRGCVLCRVPCPFRGCDRSFTDDRSAVGGCMYPSSGEDEEDTGMRSVYGKDGERITDPFEEGLWRDCVPDEKKKLEA